jgi:hypothetical protein
MSPEGDAWLAFYASPADGEPISAHLKTVAFADGEEITALQASQDQLMVSGVNGDHAFYRKARLACEGRQWHHVALEFPFSTDRQQAHSYPGTPRSRMLPSVIGGAVECLGFIWSLASARLAIGYRPTMGSGGSIYFVRLLR